MSAPTAARALVGAGPRASGDQLSLPAWASVGVDEGLLSRVRTRLARTGTGDQGLPALAALVREEAGVVGTDVGEGLVHAVRAEVTGAGVLQPLLEAPGVTDVLVTAGQVWVDRGAGLERVRLDLGTPDDVRALAVRLASAGGRRLDDAVPVVDARLPDGTRLHAVLPPLAPDGALISLRVVRSRAFTLEELVAAGSVAEPLEPVLRGLVRHRANLLVSGATGSGKTTLLSTLLSLVPPDERIVCIEEAGELAPQHPHVVRLVSRPPNVEGAGGVGLSELIRHALRMRPDRLVLGECRGAEVREVLTALNTGHDGGCATLHANAAEDVPARLEALASLAGMDAHAVAAHTASAVHAVLHLRRVHGRRHVAQVGCVRRHGAEVVVEPVLEASPDGDLTLLAGWPAFAERWLSASASRPGAAEAGPWR